MDHKWISILIFAVVVAFIMIRPRRMNEAIPAFIGGALVFLLGFIHLNDVNNVLHTVSGAAIITLSTIVMSTILERAGLFRWSARRVALKAKGSGVRLFVFAMFLSFFMTLFFNNDGSILITTPILVELVKDLRLTRKQAIPILLGPALIATSSSAPIGVSNIANLIALKIVGLNLNTYAKLMFIPSMAGIATCGVLLYLLFHRWVRFQYTLQTEPTQVFPPRPGTHIRPTRARKLHPPHRDHALDLPLFKFGISVVIVVRFGFFVAAAVNFPPELVALAGAVILYMFYMARRPRGAWRILLDVPWYIIVFAFSMYLLVFALKNIGLTSFLGHTLETWVGHSLFGYILGTGVLLTGMSSLMNNLPSVMIGTTLLTQLPIPLRTLQLSYLANILGSDIGSLIIPMGTLASLLWFHIVRKSFSISWWDYMRVSLIVIPPSLMVSLVALWGWGLLIFR